MKVENKISSRLQRVSQKTWQSSLSKRTCQRSQSNSRISLSPAFTIVELLVVIIIIAILAAITIVSYTNITKQATRSSLQSELSNVYKQLQLFQVDNDNYPTTISTNCNTNPSSSTNKCIQANPAIAYAYKQSPTNSKIFCLTATQNSMSYNLDQDGTILAGPCPVFSVDAGSKLSYPGSGTTWYDLSGNDNNGTLYGGVTYSSDGGGSMSFDGVDDYVAIVNTASLNNLTSMTISAWVYPIADVYIYQHGSSSSINGFINRFQAMSTGALYADIEDVNTLAHFTNMSSTGVIQMNKWSYLNLVVRNNLFEFYVNGTKVYTSSTFNGMYPLANCSDATRNVGRYYYNSSTISYSNGRIGDVRVYSESLLDSDILSNYNAQKGRYGL